MSLEGWMRVVRDTGEQHERERRQRVAQFDPMKLPVVARQHLVGAIHALRREFIVDGQCRFTPDQLVEAMVTAASDISAASLDFLVRELGD